jgi:hypothetical protein
MPLPAATITDIVTGFLPFLYFAPTERFFPSDVEAWIANRTGERWSAAAGHKGGTCVLVVPNDAKLAAGFPVDSDVWEGSHFPAGRRLRGSDLHEIAGAARQRIKGGEDVFLNYAGWNVSTGAPPTLDHTQGTASRLYADFSSLANAINSGNPKEPDLLEDPTQTFGGTSILPHPQGPDPFVYAEVDWAGRFPRISAANSNVDPNLDDFGPTNPILDSLDRLLVVTYYFFYPMTDAPPSPGSTTTVILREGQWEAVSAYFIFVPDTSVQTVVGIAPDQLSISVPDFSPPADVQSLSPIFWVYSRSHASDDAPKDADVRNAMDPDVFYPLSRPGSGGLVGSGTQGWRPAVYITSGTHKNKFEAVGATTVVDLGPNSSLAGAAGVFAAAGGGVSSIPAYGWVAGIILGVIAVVLGLASLLDHQKRTDFSPPGGADDDFVPPNGPTSSPRGSTPGSAAQFAPSIREIVNLLPPAAGEANQAINTPPPWWDFPGRWGLRVDSSFGSDWDSGMPRIDGFGRARSYWNTLALYRWLNLPENNGSTNF